MSFENQAIQSQETEPFASVSEQMHQIDTMENEQVDAINEALKQFEQENGTVQLPETKMETMQQIADKFKGSKILKAAALALTLSVASPALAQPGGKIIRLKPNNDIVATQPNSLHRLMGKHIDYKQAAQDLKNQNDGRDKAFEGLNVVTANPSLRINGSIGQKLMRSSIHQYTPNKSKNVLIGEIVGRKNISGSVNFESINNVDKSNISAEPTSDVSIGSIDVQ